MKSKRNNNFRYLLISAKLVFQGTCAHTDDRAKNAKKVKTAQVKGCRIKQAQSAFTRPDNNHPNKHTAKQAFVKAVENGSTAANTIALDRDTNNAFSLIFAKSIVPTYFLNCGFTRFPRTDANHLFDIRHKNLAVPDLSRTGTFLD